MENMIYTCPMHPQIEEEKPGRCPLCGMELEQIAVENKTSSPKAHDHDMDMSDNAKNHSTSMTGWQRFVMGMKMTMGMDHGGLAGREMAKLMEEDIRNKFFFSLIFTIPIVLYSPMGSQILHINLPTPIVLPWLLFLLTTPVFAFGGWLFLYSAFWSLKRKQLDMSVLIAVGISAAYLSSVLLALLGSSDSFYEAAAMLITFVLFGHWMEMRSRRGTTDALQALFDLTPPQARVLRDGHELLVPTAEVKVDDQLVLKPGDKVPVDGEIVEGETTIDESLLTGESLPVEKAVGNMVVAGSINQSGRVVFRATKIGSDTALAQIMKMVEVAQSSKAPGQKLADRYAKYLVILAIGSGAITFLLWYFLGGHNFVMSLTFAIAAVVIACPDALGLATPTAVAVGTGLGARHNILIKNAATLENLSKVSAIVMDKTGTLTDAKPEIKSIFCFEHAKEHEVLNAAAAVEAHANHPIGKIIMEEHAKRGLKLSEAKRFKNWPGLGVTAEVDGQKVAVGTAQLIQEQDINLPLAALKEWDESSARGESMMFVAVEDKVIGVIGVVDPIKKSAKLAIRKLQEMNIEVVMVTGDNQKTADAVANQIGVERVYAEVLPADKAEYVKKLQEEGKFVAMVGDGVNDAPALAQADIGIAIGAGTDVAIETADVVLMKSDPVDIIRAIRLSNATIVKMKQNLFWAAFYNLLAIPVAAGIFYPKFGLMLRPEFAALLMSISSIIVATNAVALNKAEKDLVEIK